MKTTRTIVTHLHEYTYTNGVVAHETIVNGSIAQQHFSREGFDLRFNYTPDLKKILDTVCFGKGDPEGIIGEHLYSPIIPDLETFDDWGNVFCYNVFIDCCIYNIFKDTPQPIWLYQNYIGGFTNAHFDLDELKRHLDQIPWLRNVEIVDIPHYNCCGRENEAIEFEYKIPQDLLDTLWDEFKSMAYPFMRIKNQIELLGVMEMDVFGIKHLYKERE